MAVNATDDKALADELWGDKHHWEDSLGQYVPEGGKLCPGISSSRSANNSDKRSETNPDGGSSPAPTTENPTGKDLTVDSTAHSTDTVRRARSK